MESEKISNFRRVIYDEQAYKIQSKTTATDWNTIITLEDEEIDNIAEFKKKNERERRDMEEMIHCQRCGRFNSTDNEECESCENDITDDPRVKRP